MKLFLQILSLSFICYLNFFASTDLYAQKLTKQDARILRNYIKQANVEEIRETMQTNDEPIIPNGRRLLADKKLYDSFLVTSQIIWGNGKVFYAPDSSFKLFQIDCSEKSGGCNYSTKCFLHLKSGKVISPNDRDELQGQRIDPVSSILKFDSNTYGILQEYMGCGNRHSNSTTVTQIKIQNDRLQYLPIEYKKDRPLTFNNFDNKKGTFKVWTIFLYWELKTTYLKYDRVGKKMKYSLVIGPNDAELYHLKAELRPQENQLLQVFGELKVVNGKLSFINEQYKFIKDFSGDTAGSPER